MGRKVISLFSAPWGVVGGGHRIRQFAIPRRGWLLLRLELDQQPLGADEVVVHRRDGRRGMGCAGGGKHRRGAGAIGRGARCPGVHSTLPTEIPGGGEGEPLRCTFAKPPSPFLRALLKKLVSHPHSGFQFQEKNVNQSPFQKLIGRGLSQTVTLPLGVGGMGKPEGG